MHAFVKHETLKNIHENFVSLMDVDVKLIKEYSVTQLTWNYDRLKRIYVIEIELMSS